MENVSKLLGAQGVLQSKTEPAKFKLNYKLSSEFNWIGIPLSVRSKAIVAFAAERISGTGRQKEGLKGGYL